MQTLSQITQNLSMVSANAIEILSIIQKSLYEYNTSNLSVSITNSDGSVSILQIPSIGTLQKRLRYVEDVISNLGDSNGMEFSVTDANGVVKKILKVESIKKEPVAITNFTIPNTFSIRRNFVFDNLLDPEILASLELPNAVNFYGDGVQIKRIILRDTSSNATTFWNEIQGQSAINHDTLISDLSIRNILYKEDISYINPEKLSPNSYGKFIVNGITYDNNNNYVILTVDTLLVRDVKTNTLRNLTQGEFLLLNDTTEFEILKVDNNNNLIYISQSQNTNHFPTFGTELQLKSDIDTNNVLKFSVGINEKQIVFIKPYKQDVIGNFWSLGYTIDTTNFVSDNDNKISLYEYYSKNVDDLGKYLYSLSKENVIGATDAIVPKSPVLDANSFKVELINSHLLSPDKQKISSLISNKESVKQELDVLDSEISRAKLQLQQSTNSEELSKINTIITTKSQERSLKSSDYVKQVERLNAEISTVAGISPKYRIRGFWAIPEGQLDTVSLKTQEIIGFKISYRYLGLDNSAAKSTSIKLVESKSTKQATFSEWSEIKSPIRKKTFDTNLNKWIWATETVEDGNVVNINQVEIPISKNEKVEIRIKSISEAGFPHNPIESEWSESIVIDFNEKVQNETIIDNIASSTDTQKIVVTKELTALGVDTHVANSFTNNGKYYTHTASTIASGKYNTSGGILSVEDVISNLQSQIEALQQQLENTFGELQVYIKDSDGVETIISNNSKIELFGGYYEEEKNSYNGVGASKFGAIVTKQWTLGIRNAKASTLELYSIYPGVLDDFLSNTQSDYDYQRRRYDKVPLIYSGMENSDVTNPYPGNVNYTKNSSVTQAFPYQSSQCKSQWLYLRNRNIGLVEELYKTPVGESWYEPTLPSSGSSSDVWNGNYSGQAPTGNGTLSDFCIHTSHPLLSDNSLQLWNLGSIAERWRKLERPLNSNNEIEGYSLLRHSVYFNLESSETDAKVQLQYINSDINSTFVDTQTASSPRNGFQYPQKMAFVSGDEYLIGSKTCGSYLYIDVEKPSKIRVDGSDYLAKKEIKQGLSNDILFKITYQYRMTDALGQLKGITLNTQSQVNYTKKIGIDITPKKSSIFSFDIEVSAKYKRENSLKK